MVETLRALDPAQRSRRRVDVWIMLALLALLAALARLRPLSDADTFTHVRQGLHLLQHGSWRYPDTVSFTMDGAPWTVVAPLPGLLLYGLYAAAGGDALILATAVAAAGSTVLVALVALRAAPNRPWLAVGVAAVVAAAISFRFEARSELWMLVCLPAGLLLSDSYAREHGARRPWLGVALVVFQLLWAYGHGSFVLFPIVVGAAILGHRFPGPGFARELAMPALLVALCLTAGPMGLEHLPFVMSLPYGDATSHIGEMRPLQASWMIPTGFGSFLWLDVVIAVGLLRSVYRRGARPADLILAVLGLLITVSHHRFRAAWAILMTPWAARASAGSRSKLDRPLAIAAILIAIPSTMSSRAAKDPVRGYGLGTNVDVYPVDLGAALRASNLTDGRILNNYADGAWLTFHNGDQLKVAIDGRTPTLYGDDLYFLFRRSFSEPAAFEIFDERYRPNLAAPFRVAPLCMRLARDPQWRATYVDNKRTLFVRTSTLAAPSGLNAIHACAPRRGIDEACQSQDPARIAAVRAELGRMLRLTPNASFVLTLGARLESRCGDAARGAQMARAALATATRAPQTYVDAASALARAGEVSLALLTLDDALSLGADTSARIFRGRLRLRAGDLNGGVADLEASARALDDLTPADVRLDLADGLLRQGHAARAAMHARRAFYTTRSARARALLERLGEP